MSSSIFQSPWPQSLKHNPYVQIASDVFNTVTLRTSLHKLLAQKINPATKKDPVAEKHYSNLRSQLVNPQGKYKAELLHFKAADGTLLEGILIPSSTPSNKVILFAPAEGGRYESIVDVQQATHHFITFFQEAFTDRAIFVMNTRGVGNSTGYGSLEGSTLDYYGAWSFLEREGFKEILPWGHSLGAKYLLSAAAWKQKENPKQKINFIADRSFDNITLAIEHQMNPKIIGLFTKTVYKYALWGGDTQKEWKSLKGKKLILHVATDEIIKPPISLYERSRSNLIPDLGISYELTLNPEMKDPHARAYSTEEQKTLMDFVESNQEDSPIKKIKPVLNPSNGSTTKLEDYVALLMVVTFMSLIAYSHIRHK